MTDGRQYEDHTNTSSAQHSCRLISQAAARLKHILHTWDDTVSPQNDAAEEIQDIVTLAASIALTVEHLGNNPFTKTWNYLFHSVRYPISKAYED